MNRAINTYTYTYVLGLVVFLFPFLSSIFLPQSLTTVNEGRRIFILICVSTNKFTKWIPLTFVLAFYVSIVVKRWWDIITLMPWPDSLAMKVRW